jgi:SRSO17 transposase
MMIETIPEFKLTATDIHELDDELSRYHAIYSPLFRRREQREWSLAYLAGLLHSDLPNKAVETMVLTLHGADANQIRALQQFVGQGMWEDTAILQRHWQEVAQDLDDAEGVLLVDGSDFLKKGSDSVGVKRQYCGEVGKRANCQAGVFLAYASQKGCTLLDRRLYLPQEWVEDDAYAQRRAKCAVPEGIVFQTKPELALAMVREVRQAGQLRCRWLLCDEGFARSTDFLDQVAATGLWYFGEVPLDTQVWRHRPAVGVPAGSGQGRPPTRPKLLPQAPTAQEVRALATALPADAWSRHCIHEGAKGPLLADLALLRVVAPRNGLPGPDLWLVLRRNCATAELKAYLSNAPATIDPLTLVRMSGMRWPIEQCFEDSKQLLGMRDYQVRSWLGWHHHMTLVILAHFFLVRLQRRLKKRAGAYAAAGPPLAARHLAPA